MPADVLTAALSMTESPVAAREHVSGRSRGPVVGALIRCRTLRDSATLNAGSGGLSNAEKTYRRACKWACQGTSTPIG